MKVVVHLVADAVKKLNMNNLKNLWTTIVGSMSSIFPLFFAFCKPGGACAIACASPIASLFGISSASLAATPLMKSLYPLLLVISAVSFTVSYYRLYVLPHYIASNASGCDAACACDSGKDVKQLKISKYIFWIGLLASIIFFSYFEYQNYKTNIEKAKTECCDISEEEECCSSETKCKQICKQDLNF